MPLLPPKGQPRLLAESALNHSESDSHRHRHRMLPAGKGACCAVEWTAMNSEFSGSVETEVVELRNRVLRIEEALRRRGVVLDDTKPTPAAAPSGAPMQAAGPVAAVGAPVPVPAGTTPVPPPPVRPMFASVGSPKPKDEQSLENKIGSQWFNRIGILALLIAAAWFLKFAVDNHWIGPLGRVLIGLV